MTIYTPRHEDITGSSLTGSSGDLNRTYTLANDNSVLAQMQVILSENVLQNSVNFTFDASTGVITFLGPVLDVQPISIDYLTTGETVTVSTYYCTTLQIARAAGIGEEVFLENLGTGDNSATSYNIANDNIITDSYTLKYGASGSNSFTDLTETTHYTILKDPGRIELTSAGVTALGTNVLYIDYVHSPAHSDTYLTSYLPQIVREVDKITGDYWGTPKSTIEYLDGYSSGYPQTDKPYGTQIEDYAEFILKYSGLNSITSILFLDRQGETDQTLETTDYRIITEENNNYDMQESRLLINRTIPNGKANIKVTYNHGYVSVPELIQELASYVGGVMALVNISGGSYDDISTYSFPEGSVSIGQVYVNIRESITQLKKRVDEIKELFGNNFSCV